MSLNVKTAKTERGYPLLQFTDRYGATCDIQESSLAEEAAIWFGPHDADPQVMYADAAAVGVVTNQNYGWVKYPIPDTVLLNTRMHLTQSQIAELLPILQRFAATGVLSV